MPTKLTDTWIRNTSKPGITFDLLASGLGIKITPKGRKLWIVQLTYPGHTVQSKRTLGQWPAMDVAAARTLAQQWRDAVRQGIDPKAVERQRRAQAISAATNTFTKVAEAYIATRKNRRAQPDAAAIRRHLVKAWGDMPINAITPRDVRQMIGEFAKRAPYSANEIWGHATRIFKYAVHEELIAVSPMASLDKRFVLNSTLPPRTRVLSDDEVRALWRVADKLGYPEGHFYKWLMLTACRLREVANAQWREFDLERRVWVIPAERFKSGQAHVVPLTDTMLELLATMPHRGPFVFTHDAKVAINGWGKLKRRVDAMMGKALTGPWINHDLRRTVRTNLSALKVAENVAEMVLGHSQKGLQRIYNLYRYLPEVREALEKWNARLAQIVA